MTITDPIHQAVLEVPPAGSDPELRPKRLTFTPEFKLRIVLPRTTTGPMTAVLASHGPRAWGLRVAADRGDGHALGCRHADHHAPGGRQAARRRRQTALAA